MHGVGHSLNGPVNGPRDGNSRRRSGRRCCAHDSELELIKPECAWTIAVSGKDSAGRPGTNCRTSRGHQAPVELPDSRLRTSEDAPMIDFFFSDSQDQVSPFFDFETGRASATSSAPTRRPVRARGTHQSALRRDPHFQGDRRRHREGGRQVHDGPAAAHLPLGRIIASFARHLSTEPDGDGRLRCVQLRGSSRTALHDQGGRRLLRGNRPRPWVSIDHIPFGYLHDPQRPLGVEPERTGSGAAISRWISRPSSSANFRTTWHPFAPVGVAHGWDPVSYASAVAELQNSGYTIIALGGLVPLKTHDLMRSSRRSHPCSRPQPAFISSV